MKKIIFSSGFRGFGPGSLGPVAPQSVAALCILVEARGGRELITPQWSGGGKAHVCDTSNEV